MSAYSQERSADAGPATGRAWSVRVRVLALVAVLTTAGLLVAGVATFSVQFASLNDRIRSDLGQEVEEVQQVAQSGPQGANAPYEDLDELFVAYLQSSVPNQDESMVTLVDGAVEYVPGGQRPFELERPEVLEVVTAAKEPGKTIYRSMSVDEHELQLAIASVSLAGDNREGTMVVAIDAAPQRDEIWQAVRTYAAVGFLALVLTVTAGHIVTGRLLQPLRRLGAATAAVDSDDLTHRVEVSATDTDVARVAVAFNQMLDRLEAGFIEQRQFLDDAAHELRTPLTIVRGNVELLEAGDPQDVEQTREVVLDEMDRMQRLVDDLLLLAKSQRPDFVRPHRVDVADLTQTLLERVELLGQRQWVRSGAATGHAMLDQQRIQQAIVQLAANAVAYSEADSVIQVGTGWSSPTAEVRARLGDVADRYLVIAVQDSGVGIDPDDMQRIFDRFARADVAGRVDGSGLGLSIVQAIAQAHQGLVTVDSQPGLGSTFRLWIPAARAPSTPHEPQGV